MAARFLEAHLLYLIYSSLDSFLFLRVIGDESLTIKRVLLN